MATSNTSTLKAIITADNAGATAAFDETAESAEGAGERIGAAFEGITGAAEQSATDSGTAIETGVTKIATLFDGLSTDAQGSWATISEAAGTASDASATSVEGAVTKIGSLFDGMSGDSSGAFDKVSESADAASGDAVTAVEESTAKIAELYEAMAVKVSASYAKITEAADTSAADQTAASEKSSAKSGESKTSGLTKVGEVTTIGVVGAVGGSLDLADKYDKVLGQYTVASKNAKESTSQWTSELNKSNSAATNNGFTITQNTQAMTLLADAHVPVTQQMTAMNTIMDMARAKNESLSTATTQYVSILDGKGTKAMKLFGVNINVASSNAHQLATAQRSVKDAQAALNGVVLQYGPLGGKTAAGQVAYASALRTVKNDQQNLTLAQKSSGKEMDAVNERTKGAAAVYNKTLGGSLEIAKAKVDKLSITFGQALEPALKVAVKDIGDVVSWLGKNKDIALALAGVIGTILTVAVAAFALHLVNKGVKAFKDFSNSISSTISTGKKMFSWCEQMVSKITGVGAATTAAGEESEAGFATIGEGAEEAGAAELEGGAEGSAGLALLTGGLILLVPIIIAVVALVVTHWKDCVKWLKEIWKDIKDAALDVWNFIKEHLSTIIPIIITLITGPFGLLVYELVKHWDQIRADVESLISDVVGFFSGLPDKLFDALSGIVTKIWGAFNGAAAWVDNNVIHPVVAFFTGLPQNILTALSGIVTTIWGAFSGAASWVNTNVLQPVVSYFAALPGQIVAGLGNIVSFIFSGLTGAWSWIKTNVYDPIVTGFSGLPSDIGKAMSSAASAGASLFAGIGKSIVNGIISSINDVINTIDSFLGGISAFGFHPFSSHEIPDIPHLAVGTKDFRGGLAVVGEHGPELVRLPEHAAVSTAGETAGMIGNVNGTGIGGHQITVNAQTNADPHQIADEVGWQLRVA